MLVSLDHSEALQVLQEIHLGKVEHFRVLDCPSRHVEDVARPSYIVGLEGEEASVLHADVGNRVAVFLAQRHIEGLVEELLHAFIRTHAPLKADEGQRGFDVARRNVVGKCLVEETSLWDLLLLLLKHRVLYHELDQVAYILGALVCSSVFKFGSCQTRVLEPMVDEVDVAEPELQVQIEGDQSSLVEESSSVQLALVNLEVDVGEPGLLFVSQTQVVRMDLLDFFFEAESFLYLLLSGR